MADGAFRFHQPGAGPFFSSQHNNHRNHNRATSPHGGSRRPFPNDTPSPSRSPANPNLGHNFNMYNHNGYQNQHMMNGGQTHQRYGGGGMHMPKYQANHHGHHNQVGQHHNAHHHATSHIGHQHNISSGTFQSTTPHLATYGHEHLQNGNRDTGVHDELEDGNENWQEQRRLYEEYGGMTESHHRARTVAQQSKGISFGGGLGATGDDLPLEDRSRTMTVSGQSRQIWTELDLGGQGLRALSPALFDSYTFLTRLDLGHNQLNSLPSAIGQLKSLEFLDASFNNLEDLPEEIGMLTNLKSLLLFGNNLESLNNELGFLYNLETLGIYGNPLDDELKSKMTEGGTKAVIVYLRETMPEPAPPRERPWHELEERPPADAQVETVKALTYNILCERYATPAMYGYVPERVLNWSYRRQLILDEIRSLDADFVCLQELDKHSYDEYFRSSLSVNGYKGYFAQKGRAETLGDNAKFVDGCGTFWKDKKYMLLDTQHLVLGRRAVSRPGAKASADMLNRVWQRDDIATVVFLENRVTGSRVIVGNAHIFWDPAFKDVKLIQAAVLMEELSKLAEKYAGYAPSTNKQIFRFSDDDSEPNPEPGPSLEYSSGTQIPMIICGDFNSSSDSAVYNLFTKRALEAEHIDLDGRDYGSFSKGGMSHSFSLKTAYDAIDAMPFSNYTPEFVDLLDHIWFSSNSLRVTGLLGEVDPEYLKRVPGFPNFHFPSDHLALMAEFRVEKIKTRKEAVEADFGNSSTSNHGYSKDKERK